MFSRGWLFVVAFSLFLGVLWAVPAHPLKKTEIQNEAARHSLKRVNYRHKNILPQKVLALRVEFSDVKFNLTPQYPDSLAHDKVYFERYLLHLNDYWSDASRGQYHFDYSVFDRVIALDKPMSYYGNDEESGQRMAEFCRDALAKADSLLDFSQYEAYIIFHAGAGQEADLNSLNSDELWSTFVTLSDLREAFAPDDTSYPGLATHDVDTANRPVFLHSLLIAPETEWQPDFTPGGENAIALSILGVLCHQFGHRLGLPTLFDNDNANGKSQGIGNWGLMGTGAWNANGYVPPMPCAYSRVLLGWETPVVVDSAREALRIIYPQAKSNPENIPYLYKIPINEREYFLIENISQNPDRSTFYGQPSYTFTLVDNQDYYDYGAPKFNFMKNRYKGCEWNFFTPGLGGPDSPVVDGSGILIWHIDEDIIEANFTSDFEYNSINADGLHKGVDLEEADGTQHLDTFYPSIYMYGGPDDTFRARANTSDSHEFQNLYFGQQTIPHDIPELSAYAGHISSPTAVANSGGIPVEIYNFSPSDTVMSFSVRFGWQIKVDTPLATPALITDFNNDGTDDFYVFTASGKFFVYQGQECVYEESGISASEAPALDNEGRLFVPAADNGSAKLIKFVYERQGFTKSIIYDGSREIWVSAPVVGDNFGLLPLSNGEDFILRSFDAAGDVRTITTFNATELLSNLAVDGNTAYFIVKESDGNTYNILLDLQDGTFTKISKNLPYNTGDHWTIGLVDNDYLVMLKQGEQEGDNLFIWDLNATDAALKHNYAYAPGKPILNFGDIDHNGKPEILFNSDREVHAFTLNAEKLIGNFGINQSGEQDSLSSGVTFYREKDSNQIKLISPFAGSVMQIFGGKNDFNYFKAENTLATGTRITDMPYLREEQGMLYLYIISMEGRIKRTLLEENSNVELPFWCTEFGDYLHKAVWRSGNNTQNIHATEGIFIKGRTFIYPNPYIPAYHSQNAQFNIELNKDAAVECKIWNIAGELLYKKKEICYANSQNRDKFRVPGKLTSGVYFVKLRAENEDLLLKFAIER